MGRAVLSMIARRVPCVAGLLLLNVGLLVAPARATVGQRAAQSVVRDFCQADGFGQRVLVWTWGNVAPLVTWELEPAWDHVVLIGGFGVGAPRPDDTGVLAVDVRYSVIGQVSPLGLDPTVYVETVTFQVGMPDEGGWRIIGPPPPPHIFANRVDVEAMRRSLEQGGFNFLPNTIFVWQMFRAAGWDIPFERTVDLLSGPAYQPVDSAAPGDLVVYLRDGVPYHVGLLEAENQILSSTLNAGIVRTGIDAFAGDLKYLRVVAPEPAPLPDLVIPTPSAGDALAPSAGRTRPAPTPPSNSKKPHASVRRSRKPATHRSATKRGGTQAKRASKTARRKPVATRKTR
jgi:hypothetical protein